eukprot:UN31603
MSLKVSHNQVKFNNGVPNHISNKTWFFGVACLCINPIFSFASFYFAPPTLLVPLTGLTIVWNVVLAPFLLPNEPLTKPIIGGCVLVLVGCILVSLVGPKSENTTYSYPELMLLFLKPNFLLYFGFFVILIIVTSINIYIQSKRRRFLEQQLYTTIPPTNNIDEIDLNNSDNIITHHDDIITSDADALSNNSILGSDSEIQCTMVTKLCYAFLAGSLSGFTFLTKSSTLLLRQDSSSLGQLPTWLIFIMAGACPVAGLMILNAGLKTYDALFLLPTFHAFLVFVGASSNAIFFEDLKFLSSEQLWVYIISAFLICVGIFFVGLYKDFQRHSLCR